MIPFLVTVNLLAAVAPVDDTRCARAQETLRVRLTIASDALQPTAQTGQGAVTAIRGRSPLVSRVLGYAVAHEIGHFVLATKTHSSASLMQPTYRHPDNLADLSSWELDERNRARLKQRQSSGCGADSRAAVTNDPQRLVATHACTQMKMPMACR